MNLAIKVNWTDERPDDNDTNDGFEYGIYIMDCEVDEYDPEVGYGGYDIVDAMWYKTEKERNIEFETLT